MHFHCGQTRPPIPTFNFHHDSYTRSVNHSKRGQNQPCKWYPKVQVMGCNITTITPQKTTLGGGIPNKVKPTSTNWHTGGWHRIERIFNVWIHWRHHHPNHWWPIQAGDNQNTAFLLTHTILRPFNSSEPLKQDDPLYLNKPSVEGHLVEIGTCLFWYIQTRSLKLLLTKQKETSWVKDIRVYLY